MSRILFQIAGVMLLVGISIADAGPNIPPSELPGRERERFQPSPLDKFTQPGTQQGMGRLWRWECKSKKARGKKHRRSVSRRC